MNWESIWTHSNLRLRLLQRERNRERNLIRVWRLSRVREFLEVRKVQFLLLILKKKKAIVKKVFLVRQVIAKLQELYLKLIFSNYRILKDKRLLNSWTAYQLNKVTQFLNNNSQGFPDLWTTISIFLINQNKTRKQSSTLNPKGNLFSCRQVTI